ncbi:hypothetical protein GpartN1_g3096.t1 [Galdieria partita]|uniref:Cleavage and polyadenylation specificity factor subunit 2 n=1 Tax=Galdieria partita TaxID=83374 RepID=A0A9C7UQ85_9RHOD|nr:hypothetical protein GpartN1_g3096.t1 [Galdieria partita]
MSSILRFTPLYGVKTEDLAVCYLLEVDDFRILLDCGWNDHFDETLLEPLRRVAPRVDAVLISHPDLYHLGALPYAVAKLGLRAPTYTTLPVWRMGQLFMYDAHQSRAMQEDFQVFDLDDVDSAFENFIQLKYQQIVNFSERGKGITITPHPAGHMIGGTIWKIQTETEEIVYANDFNHKRERHLNPTTLQYLTRPSHLIIGASQALVRPSSSSSISGQQFPKGSQIYSRSNPLTEICEEALKTLRQGGDVIIPVDTAGRVLELALGFEEFWATEKLGSSYAVAIIEHVSFNTIDFAKSMMEWMSDAIINKFDTTRENPFHLKHIHLCHSRSELGALSSPKVILASLASLECGFSRELVVEMASNKMNKLILVDRLEPNTLAHSIYSLLEGESEGKTAQVPRLALQLNRRVPLQGTELEEYFARMKNSNESASLLQGSKDLRFDNRLSTLAEDEQEEEDLSSVSDDEKDNMHAINHFGSFSGEGKIDQARSEMIVFSNDREQKDDIWDDYGLVIDTKCFMIGEDPGEIEGDSEELSEASMDETMNNPMDFRGLFQEDEQVPTKCIQVNITLEVACQIRYIGCAGLSDGRSLRQLLTAVSPRRVIIVHGSRKETAAIKEFCERGLTKDIFCPRAMETIDITTDTSIFRLTLRDRLLSSCTWKKVGDYELSFLDGTIRVENEVSTKEKETNMNRTQEYVLEQRPSLDSGHPIVFVGEGKLSDLRPALSRAGIPSDFIGGVLVVEDRETGAYVLVRKIASQMASLEGPLCPDYFEVRKLLLQLYTIL